MASWDSDQPGPPRPHDPWLVVRLLILLMVGVAVTAVVLAVGGRG